MASASRICNQVIKRKLKSFRLLLVILILIVIAVFFKYDLLYLSRDMFKNTNPKSTTLEKKTLEKYIGTQGKFIRRTTSNAIETTHSVATDVCYNVHAFYYPWYGNPTVDNEYLHWKHQYIAHWNPSIAGNYPKGSHVPPDDIGSNFYPFLGSYSSSDPSIIEDHMKQLQFAGIGVIAVSYYPPGMSDDNGKDWKHVFPILLEKGVKYGIKIAFHIEPYRGRTEETVKEDIRYIIESFAMYPSFYQHSHNGKKLPLMYVYDSYHTKPLAWAKVLGDGDETIRGTAYDAFVIGLVVEQKDLNEIITAGFDGFYTYFAADGFTYGSTRHNWRHLGEFSMLHGLIYIPSVGPGYIDTRVRPWNAQNTRHRLKGKYYSQSWETSLAADTEIISITSFNEWHEGTQIEKAIPKHTNGFTYSNYNPHASDYYLELTRIFIRKFKKCAMISK